MYKRIKNDSIKSMQRILQKRQMHPVLFDFGEYCCIYLFPKAGDKNRRTYRTRRFGRDTAYKGYKRIVLSLSRNMKKE